MPSNIIRYPRKGDPAKLYTPNEIVEMTGVGRPTAVWLCKHYGVTLKHRFYITMEQYDRAIKDLSAKEVKA